MSKSTADSQIEKWVNNYFDGLPMSKTQKILFIAAVVVLPLPILMIWGLHSGCKGYKAY